jgi:hypothetical protein
MWYHPPMTKTVKTRGRSKTYTIGRSQFAKISAVEGIRPTRRMEEDFEEFDRRALTPAERRREIARRYGRKI